MVDNEENVAGLLNIAKCLYDAIHRLEKKAMKAEEDKQKGGGGGLDLAASVLQVRGIGLCDDCLSDVMTEYVGISCRLILSWLGITVGRSVPASVVGWLV